MIAFTSTASVTVYVEDDISCLRISENEIGDRGTDYEALRFLVRVVCMPLIQCSSSSMLLGSPFTSYVHPDQYELGWIEGEHYVRSRVECLKGLSISQNPDSWFFKEIPLNAGELNFDQAFVNDSICIFIGYHGPGALDELIPENEKLASQNELIAKFLTVCNHVMLVDYDGTAIFVYESAAETYAQFSQRKDMIG